MAAQQLAWQEVLTFWFEELESADWFTKSSALDEDIRRRFSALHQQAVTGDLDAWIEDDQGALALVIVLDQFSRNMYRDTPQAFSADAKALQIAQAVVKRGGDGSLGEAQRAFLYMPYMHSEDRQVHRQAVELYTDLGNATNLDYELRHQRIIDRFGRYPHRNHILGRESTDEEKEFLLTPGSSF